MTFTKSELASDHVHFLYISDPHYDAIKIEGR